MLYPIVLNLDGCDVLVVGGGPVAARKVAGLVEAGARVRVVSRQFVPELLARTDIRRHNGAYASEAIGSARLVFACTDEPAVNAAVAADARAAGASCNVVADPGVGDFHVPAVLRRGDLLVAVSTGGAGPHLAAWLRDRLASQIPPELGILVEELQRVRPRVREQVPDEADRCRIFATLCADCSVQLLSAKGRDAWRAWFERVLEHRATRPDDVTE